MLSSGILRRVDHLRTDFSDENVDNHLQDEKTLSTPGSSRSTGKRASCSGSSTVGSVRDRDEPLITLSLCANTYVIDQDSRPLKATSNISEQFRHRPPLWSSGHSS
jgi:hypothetical protein